MMYVKVENGNAVRYPYTMDDLRRDRKNGVFPENPPEKTLQGLGVHEVVKEPAPAYDTLTQTAVQWRFPKKNTDQGYEKWVLGWDVVNLPHNQAAKNLRQIRNQLLVESDWTQVADAPVDQAAWATYRQALRDLTKQDGFPYSVEWPTKPG